MERSLTAALLSALVFPGAGQFYLKRPWRACLFMLPALAAAFLFVRQVMALAGPLVDKVLSGGLAADPLAIAAELERQGGVAGGHADLAAAVMIVCWIASIADAWLLARSTGPGTAPVSPP